MEEKNKDLDNVIDLWAYKIRRDMEARDKEMEARKEKFFNSRPKLSIMDKIRIALEKYGSYRGFQHKKDK